MIPRNKIRLAIGVLAAAAAAGLWYLVRPREAATASASSAAVTAVPAQRTTASPPAPSPEPPQPTTPAPALIETAETKATSRMIMAHAPLRAPAVADPDSKENREILQTMLSKALARKEAPPPAPPAPK